MSSDASEADADADAADEGTNALLFERWAVANHVELPVRQVTAYPPPDLEYQVSALL